jgi:hypothetical protein
MQRHFPVLLTHLTENTLQRLDRAFHAISDEIAALDESSFILNKPLENGRIFVLLFSKFVPLPSRIHSIMIGPSRQLHHEMLSDWKF